MEPEWIFHWSRIGGRQGERSKGMNRIWTRARSSIDNILQKILNPEAITKDARKCAGEKILEDPEIMSS